MFRNVRINDVVENAVRKGPEAVTLRATSATRRTRQIKSDDGLLGRQGAL